MDRRAAKNEGLSLSAQRAKWIDSVDEREDHEGQTLATRNPDVSRAWAQARKATPATIPDNDPDEPRVLRFDFPGYDDGLKEVGWDAWLGVFERRRLVFLFREHLKSGKRSNFFRLDSPEREDAGAASRRRQPGNRLISAPRPRSFSSMHS